MKQRQLRDVIASWSYCTSIAAMRARSLGLSCCNRACVPEDRTYIPYGPCTTSCPTTTPYFSGVPNTTNLSNSPPCAGLLENLLCMDHGQNTSDLQKRRIVHVPADRTHFSVGSNRSRANAEVRSICRNEGLPTTTNTPPTNKPGTFPGRL